MRILGVSVPENKVIPVALSYVYGIGRPLGEHICKTLNVPVNHKIQDLDQAQQQQMADFIIKNFTIEGDLKREVAANIQRLKDLMSYRGRRHRAGLPSRGQRTHSNARTRRGKIVRMSTKKR